LQPGSQFPVKTKKIFTGKTGKKQIFEGRARSWEFKDLALPAKKGFLKTLEGKDSRVRESLNCLYRLQFILIRAAEKLR